MIKILLKLNTVGYWIRPGLRNILGVDVGSASAFTVNVLSYAETPVLK